MCIRDRIRIDHRYSEKRSNKSNADNQTKKIWKNDGYEYAGIFFDIEKDSMIMFDGLKVAKNNKMLCEKWMNQCPVIFLSFKDVDGRTFENVFELLKFTIAQFCDAHAWLENSEKVTDAQKEIFKRLKNGTASMIDVQTLL